MDRELIRLQREVDKAKYNLKVANIMLAVGVLGLMVVIAGWVAIIWAGIASIGVWDAFGMVSGVGSCLLFLSFGAGMLFAFTFDVRSKAGLALLKSRYAYEDRTLFGDY